MSYRTYQRDRFSRSLRQAFIEWMKREWILIRSGEITAF